MIARIRFRLYRWLLGVVTVRDFKSHEVWPLEIPSDDTIRIEPLSPELPRLYIARNFPATDHASSRHRGSRLRGLLLPLVARIPARRTAPIASDLEDFLDQVYPARYRKIWPHPPSTPPEFEADDMLAALATSSPFSIYLRSASALERDVGTDLTEPFDFAIDMRVLDRYSPKDGLVPPGGLALFASEGDHLRTLGVIHQGTLHRPGDDSFERASRALRCALNTHLSTLVHNAGMHIAYVTAMGVATINELRPDHPIRRLLHPAVHTTTIGNYQLGTFQLKGDRAFAAILFSHDANTLAEIINEYLDGFRPADFAPDIAFTRAGLDDTSLALPVWDDLFAIWTITLDYVTRYVDHYFADDGALAADQQLQNWASEVDRLLPNGLGSHTAGTDHDLPLTREGLIRICATFLHTSSALHDLFNNTVWDYSLLNYAIPTVVPESLEQQDVRLSFDLMNTFIGTWKPYNMLLDGLSQLALDDVGAEIMDNYIEALRARQATMEAEPRQRGRVFPAGLNPSVSN